MRRGEAASGEWRSYSASPLPARHPPLCSGGVLPCVGEADGPPRAALERPVHGARVADEVRARPREAGEKHLREHVAFEAVAARAGGDEVAVRVRAPLRERVDVIYCGEVQLE